MIKWIRLYGGPSNPAIPNDFLISENQINPIYITSKQDVLVSGTNIKTINNSSILGSGNITLDSWNKTGNAGTNPVTDFIGTTDSQPVRFGANSVESARIFSATRNWNIGGTVDEGFKLDVNGTARVSGNLTVGTNTLFVDATNNRLGIGTTSPSARLQINIPTSTTIGKIIRAAASQTANLTEWQNSAGTVLSAVTSAGNFGINQTTAGYPLSVTGNADFAALGPVYVRSSGGGNIGTALSLDATDNIAGRKWSFISTGALAGPGAGSFAVYNSTDSRYEWLTFPNGRTQFGINLYTDLGARVAVQPESASTRGLVVRAAASQTANLTEWQNSAGTVLSAVTSAGNVGIGTTTPTGKLTIQAQGSLSTDNVFSIRNSANTSDILNVTGDSKLTAAGLFVNGNTNSFLTISSNTGIQSLSWNHWGELASIKNYSQGYTSGGYDVHPIKCAINIFKTTPGGGNWHTGKINNIVSGTWGVAEWGTGLTQPPFSNGSFVPATICGGFHWYNAGDESTITYNQRIAWLTPEGKLLLYNNRLGVNNAVIGDTDAIGIWSQDIVAGNAALHVRSENGAIIKLYQETTSVSASTLVSNGGTALTDTDTIDGYTLKQIVKALRNQGLLA